MMPYEYQELLKEREKYTVLKMQNSSLEDRVRVAHQELQVYKSIDVYHSSMKVFLTTANTSYDVINLIFVCMYPMRCVLGRVRVAAGGKERLHTHIQASNFRF